MNTYYLKALDYVIVTLCKTVILTEKQSPNKMMLV